MFYPIQEGGEEGWKDRRMEGKEKGTTGRMERTGAPISALDTPDTWGSRTPEPYPRANRTRKEQKTSNVYVDMHMYVRVSVSDKVYDRV